jgi:hypothetical protein
MKTLALACLLGISLLAPIQGTFAAPEKTNAEKKIVDCSLEGQVLLASSNQSDGELKWIKIISYPSLNMVAYTTCEGYSCSLSVAGLPTGQYYAEVLCHRTTHTFWFNL